MEKIYVAYESCEVPSLVSVCSSLEVDSAYEVRWREVCECEIMCAGAQRAL